MQIHIRSSVGESLTKGEAADAKLLFQNIKRHQHSSSAECMKILNYCLAGLKIHQIVA